MQAEARFQVKPPALRLQFVSIDQVAVGAAIVSLEFFLGKNGTVAGIEQVNLFAALKLQQEIVLRVHVIRRDRSGRRHEDEALRQAHAGADSLGVAFYFREAFMQQGPIVRIMLDVLEYHPRLALRDAANGFLGAKAIAR